jgi:hypothetical protein
MVGKLCPINAYEVLFSLLGVLHVVNIFIRGRNSMHGRTWKVKISLASGSIGFTSR